MASSSARLKATTGDERRGEAADTVASCAWREGPPGSRGRKRMGSDSLKGASLLPSGMIAPGPQIFKPVTRKDFTAPPQCVLGQAPLPRIMVLTAPGPVQSPVSDQSPSPHSRPISLDRAHSLFPSRSSANGTENPSCRRNGVAAKPNAGPDASADSPSLTTRSAALADRIPRAPSLVRARLSGGSMLPFYSSHLGQRTGANRSFVFRGRFRYRSRLRQGERGERWQRPA